jgi:hypothetical protein
MATTYKVLGQSYPAATTPVDIYTVGAGKSAIISTLSVCNTSASAATFRVAIRPAGETLGTKHYIAYGATVTPNDTNFITIGITLAATDVITIYSSVQGLVFNVFGTEIN